MDINATASSIFGSASSESLFSAGQSAPPTDAQEAARVAVDAHQREINRIRGYKLALTPTERQKLAEIQTKIQEIEGKASAGTVRPDELDDRVALFEEADRIIGKPTVDIEADAVLADLSAKIDTLLEPKLDKARANRLAYLERIKASLEEKIADNPERRTPQLQFQSVSRLVAELNPPRAVSELSLEERKAYDDLVELINEHVGVKVELSSRVADRVAQLQRSITNLQGQLAPDASQQPTPQAVARAYVRLA